MIDIATNQIAHTIQVGHFPVAVALTPDGKSAYVANSEDFTVSVIDTSRNTVVDTIGPAGIGNPPSGIAVVPNGKHVYVPYCAPDAVAVIDTKTNALICPQPEHAGAEGEVHRRERLGGLLNYYHRTAA